MPIFAPGTWQGINQSMAIDREQVAAKQLQAQREQGMRYQNQMMDQSRHTMAMQDQKMMQGQNVARSFQMTPPNPGQASLPAGGPPPQGMGPPQQPQGMPQGMDQYQTSGPPPVPAYRSLSAAGGSPQQSGGGAPPGNGAPPPVGQQQGGYQLPTHEQLEQNMNSQGVGDPMDRQAAHDKLQTMIDGQLNTSLKKSQLAESELRLKTPKAPQTRNVFNGRDETQQEFVNGEWKTYGQGPRFAKAAAVGGTGGPGSAGSGNGIVAGDIDSVPKSDRATVKAISEGRQKISDVGYRGADRKRLMDMVNAYNPDYNPESNKSTQTARTQVVKDLAAIRPFKEMLDTNIDVAVGLGKKVIASDSKFANKSINWIKQNTGDNPDTAEYLAQMVFVQTEAARVLNNPRLVGQLTDSARHEMQEVVAGNMPMNSLERVLKRIQSDGKNRVAAMVKEKANLDRDISGAKPEASGEDKAAIDWAKANPDDPRAKKIISMHGG